MTTNQDRKGPGQDKRGFASMPEEKVREIASKGGHASAEKAGHEGMAERGSKGGQVSAERAGHEGMAERGSKGGHARWSGKESNEDDSGNDNQE